MFIADKERNVIHTINSLYGLSWQSIFENNVSIETLNSFYETSTSKVFSKDYFENFLKQETVLMHHIAVVKKNPTNDLLQYAINDYDSLLSLENDKTTCPIQKLQFLWLSHLLKKPNLNLQEQILYWLNNSKITTDTYHNQEFILIFCQKALEDFLPGGFRDNFKKILIEKSNYYSIPNSINKIFIPDGLFRNKEKDEYFYFNYPVMLDTRRNRK